MNFAETTWISYSSIKNFLQCPQSYFFANVYRDPKTNHKISPVSPPLSLGQIVHEVLEELSSLPAQKRFDKPLTEMFLQKWKLVSGKLGGFTNQNQEESFKSRGVEMLKMVQNNPGPLANLAIKLPDALPSFWLNQIDQIKLCGKIDWLEYLPDSDEVHIIDFKTSKSSQEVASMQLPIYVLLTTHVQKRPVKKTSYWYLGLHDKPLEQEMPDIDNARSTIEKVAQEIRLARKLNRFPCARAGSKCHYCLPYQTIIEGKATFVGTGVYNQDLYLVPQLGIETQETELIH
jgi:ATP-dependent helicase/DNAse subunit B